MTEELTQEEIEEDNKLPYPYKGWRQAKINLEKLEQQED